jgi:hypothetical protein
MRATKGTRCSASMLFTESAMIQVRYRMSAQKAVKLHLAASSRRQVRRFGRAVSYRSLVIKSLSYLVSSEPKTRLCVVLPLNKGNSYRFGIKVPTSSRFRRHCKRPMSVCPSYGVSRCRASPRLQSLLKACRISRISILMPRPEIGQELINAS